MSVRGIGDGYAFQRLLWLLVGTVIVPTILLALYGVMAIRNQNAAIVQRVQVEQEIRLQFATRVLFQEIQEIDAGMRSAARACGAREQTTCVLSADGVVESWYWPDADLPPLELSITGLPAETSTDTVWFSPSDGGNPIGTFSVDGARAAWRLDTETLIARLEQLAADRYDGQVVFSLEGSADRGPILSLDEMMERWQEPRTWNWPLERPLNRWRLVASYGDSDPIQEIVGRTQWMLPAGLFVLVTLVIVGTVVTLTSAAREIRLSRLQTDFVSSVSHELRTPLTSIRMFVETLQSGRLKDPERIEECLDLLSYETDRLSRMIERVLGWARMEAGRRIYEIEDVSAEILMEDAIRALRSQRLLDDAVDIRVDIPADLPNLRVDRDAIVEALLNLLQNAVKYTPSPQKIELSAIRRGSRIGLSVDDNGLGIAQADRHRIFEKFYQADTLLSSVTQMGAERGSGLGLSIVRAVTRGHGGRVELHTELGKGSRFTLWLPMGS
jgi:signal transduction histidine kinase